MQQAINISIRANTKAGHPDNLICGPNLGNPEPKIRPVPYFIQNEFTEYLLINSIKDDYIVLHHYQETHAMVFLSGY